MMMSRTFDALDRGVPLNKFPTGPYHVSYASTVSSDGVNACWQYSLYCTHMVAVAALLCSLLVSLESAKADPLPSFAIEQLTASVWAEHQSRLCTVALRLAERRYHLPSGLLVSVARAESGRPIKSLTDVRPWPWTINADGTGLFFDSKAAAISWMQDQAPNHSLVDVGCMQVDLHYHPNAFISMDDAFDPTANADYAARLLVHLHRSEAHGRWDIAIGLYHSHTSQLAAEFRDRVELLSADLMYRGPIGVPRSVRSAHQHRLRLTWVWVRRR